MSTINRSVEIVFRICGLWPGSAYAPFYKFHSIFSFGILITLNLKYIIKCSQYTDLPDLMENLSMFLAFALIFIKLIIFCFNHRTLGDLLAVMAIDWEQNVDSEFNARMMAKKANLSHNFLNLLLGFYTTTVLAYMIIIYTASIFSESSERELILKMDLPFDSNKRLVYEFIMLIQIFYLLLYVAVDAVINGFFVGTVLHASGQIRILCGWLIEIFPRNEKYRIQVTTVDKIIKKHQDIITFSKKIEKLYSYITVLQFLSDTLIICGLGFILMTSLRKPNAWGIIIKTCLFYFSMTLEAFTYCFAGEYLITESKAIADAAYNSLWYKSTSKDSQMILFLIMRSQNQLNITIGKITELSLKKYGDIIKASASYISVLLAMY